ncbi:MAG: hypothetical protein A2X25_09435 [Chloroflexi bacterium GWB2_49_20]|nr:MAG: hypothetical protein A2X25_09435 [Chloroflexi bacterium GWB2_49_20]OGN79354.1 MAG: hypothetical protein A2X26_04590 [Chloroflexi bacterium GWC2_49_37]OGN82876.1 MAG: hypothetical protein A2X27_08105 [Chloroflexi bacterium GWD2_49_16]HCC78529.1 hypothetical protein [Anaerolineae bacterium]
MKILAINGSPRKNGHTVKLLEAALEAARRRDVQTALIHLIDYDIRHCKGCYACARGSCPQGDDMARLLSDIQTCQSEGVLYGAPVFDFNLPGLLIDFWNRNTGMSGYFQAREEGNLDEWLARNRIWKVGAGIVQAGRSGGQKTALKHVNFKLLIEAERVLPGMAAHTHHWDQALRQATSLGRKLARALEVKQGSYPLWQMPFIYKRLTCFEFPRP